MKYYLRLQIGLLVIFAFFFLLNGCSNNDSVESTEAIDTSTSAESDSGYPVNPGYPGSAVSITRLNVTSTRVVEVSPPQPNLTTITGVVFSERSNAPIVEVPVQLAEVYYEGGRGAFVLDLGQSPTAFTDGQGRFVFVDIEPRDYVIVIGNVEVNDYVIVPEENGKARVWSSITGDVLDTGDHWVLLDSWE